MDQTLVNSRSAKPYRRSNWPKAYEKIEDGSVACYDGIKELLESIHARGGKIGIVSTSIDEYLKRIVRKFDLPVDTIVGYRSDHKPNPNHIRYALNNLGIKEEEYKKVLSFGDDRKDIVASRGAGVSAAACIWDPDEDYDLAEYRPDYICKSVEEMRILVERSFKENE
jgi:pyrophosphatase PpaX